MIYPNKAYKTLVVIYEVLGLLLDIEEVKVSYT
jgi:hypothetical protein